MVGMFATVLIQSSSSTTSITVVKKNKKEKRRKKANETGERKNGRRKEKIKQAYLSRSLALEWQVTHTHHSIQFSCFLLTATIVFS